MTAGNLFCGFAAILAIVEGISEPGLEAPYYRAIWFILGACVFDLLDGRMARLAGAESDFGREFDSITDVVSFGVAPALLIFHLVLQEIPDQYGKLIAFVYLLCGAMRLARFNCEAAMPDAKASRDFRGLPIPAAAGVIVSITLALLHYVGDDQMLPGVWKHVLWVLMLLVSYLMFSNITFPSFKGLNWRTKRSLPWVFVAVIVIVFTVKNPHSMPALGFVSYMLYGFVRPWVSRRWRRQIEIELESEPDTESREAEIVGTEDADGGESGRERPV
ncbi:MAG: CDP-diacylglycerol--serine O-phosphatidyltransferase [Verrucomicrobiales bacterium]|nr:CDP-diacylglycerol--serine O-phosphatidyltransferase [Verrucomicrobiales bacterium]